MTNEERAERELDAIMRKVADAIFADEAGTQIVDPKRMREFLACGEVMKKLFQGRGNKVQVVPHDDFPSVGTIRVFTKQLSISDPLLFYEAASLSSNYEIYPKLDGTVVLALTFYGLTKK